MPVKFEIIDAADPSPTAIKKAAKLAKGAHTPRKEILGSVTKSSVKEIAQLKMPDLNASDVEAAIRIVMGTARSMGVEVEGN